MTLRVVPLDAAQLPGAAALLARAFRDSPLNRRVLGGRGPAARLRANARGLGAALPAARVHGLVTGAWADGVLGGVLVAAPPPGGPFPAPPLLTRLRTVLGQGLAVAGRWAAVEEELAGWRLGEAHWRLASLGVEPALAGRGIGGALLSEWLARVDRDALPARLETDEPRNLAFYARVGFDVAEERALLGAPVWLMRRAPRRIQ
jgi:ribosomal protein S18 acetylase RimI-like enzyme